MKKLLLVASALALFGLSGTAFAQPSNDDFDGATVVTEPLPFTDSVSTVDATRAADDPTCSDNDHTVWYSYTASADGFITSNTFGSDYDTTLSVYTGDRGTLTQVACNDDAVGGGVLQSKVTWEAVAATTYHITAGSFSGGEGGNLSLTVQQGEPLLEIEDLSVDPIGRIDPSTRVATISGTVTCSKPVEVGVDGELRKRVGRQLIRGNFFTLVQCDGETPWSATVEDENGNFAPGKAQVSADAFGCFENLRLRADHR